MRKLTMTMAHQGARHARGGHEEVMEIFGNHGQGRGRR
jgi:hypothetical protein